MPPHAGESRAHDNSDVKGKGCEVSEHNFDRPPVQRDEVK
jgi:hypothetical protein